MNKKELRAWKTVSRKTILEHGKFLTVESHTIKLPDGRLIPDWGWLIIPSAAIVLAVTEDGKFLCFRQTKYAVEGTSMAPVGGMLEPDEKPLDAAKRELLEETGYVADTWEYLGVMHPCIGYSDERIEIFRASGLRNVGAQTLDHNEFLEIVELAPDAARQAVWDGRITDAKTITALYWLNKP